MALCFGLSTMHAGHSCCTSMCTTLLRLHSHAGPSSLTWHLCYIDRMSTANSVIQSLPCVLPGPHLCRDKAAVNKYSKHMQCRAGTQPALNTRCCCIGRLHTVCVLLAADLHALLHACSHSHIRMYTHTHTHTH